MKRTVKIPVEQLVNMDFSQEVRFENMAFTIDQNGLCDVVFSEDGKTGMITYDTLDVTEPRTVTYISAQTGQETTVTLQQGVYGRPGFYDAETMEELTEQDIADMLADYDPWIVGETFELNESGNLPDYKRTYEGKLYKIIQPHTSQADWTPDIAPALYREIMPEQVIAPWVQPDGAHDAYYFDDKVTWNGKTWVSDVDDNIWEPGVYGWSEV